MPSFRTARAALGWASLVLSLILLVGLGLLPHLGLYRPVTVLSNSMKPTFRAGDLIVVAPEPLRDIRPGQAVTYSVPVGDHQVVTHRVVEVVRAGDRPVIVTKGDANAAADPWTAQLGGDVAWRYRLTIPYGGRAVLFLRSPAVRTTGMYLVPALVALMCLIRIWRPGADSREKIRAAA